MTSSFGGFSVTGCFGANLSFFGCSVASDMVEGCISMLVMWNVECPRWEVTMLASAWQGGAEARVAQASFRHRLLHPARPQVALP
jgi:hypothetical protein